MPEYIKAAKKSDIPAGTGKRVEIAGQKVAVFNVGGAFYAISDTCAHRGGPLSEGTLEGSTVTCPWHGWSYDVNTGAAVHQAASVAAYPLKLEGEDVLVAVSPLESSPK